MLGAMTRSLMPALLLTCSLACKVEDTPGGDEVGGTGTETGTDTTETESESESTDSSSDEGNFITTDPTDTTDTTETGDPPEPLTCQEMLDCVFMCLGDLGLECLQTCGAGFDPVEVQKAGALVLCLGQVCVEKEQCSLDALTDPACVGCIGLGLFLPEPPGCEAEAMACE